MSLLGGLGTPHRPVPGRPGTPQVARNGSIRRRCGTPRASSAASGHPAGQFPGVPGRLRWRETGRSAAVAARHEPLRRPRDTPQTSSRASRDASGGAKRVDPPPLRRAMSLFGSLGTPRRPVPGRPGTPQVARNGSIRRRCGAPRASSAASGHPTDQFPGVPGRLRWRETGRSAAVAARHEPLRRPRDTSQASSRASRDAVGAIPRAHFAHLNYRSLLVLLVISPSGPLFPPSWCSLPIYHSDPRYTPILLSISFLVVLPLPYFDSPISPIPDFHLSPDLPLLTSLPIAFSPPAPLRPRRGRAIGTPALTGC